MIAGSLSSCIAGFHQSCRFSQSSGHHRHKVERSALLRPSGERRSIDDGGSAMKTPSVKSVRCAIYTRVSTEQGLDQEFNSLDAQYDAASAYIRSQAHAGWTLIRSRYEDGWYSGWATCRTNAAG